MREKLDRLKTTAPSINETSFMHELQTAHFMYAWGLAIKRRISGDGLVDHTTLDPISDRLLIQDVKPT